MDRFSFEILGPLTVRRGPVTVEIASRKQRLLLLLLLARAGQVVPVDEVIELLWYDRAPDKARATLHFHVSKLRDALEPAREKGAEGSIILTRPPGYLADISPQWVDAAQFEEGVRRGQGLVTTDPGAATEILEAALALWRGPALADAAYEEFARTEIRRLDELRLAAIESRIEAELALGRHGKVTPELEKLVADNPLRERLTAHLMLALYRSGRQADALGAYRAAQTALIAELGIEPSTELQQLETDIVLQSPQLEHRSTAMLNLPHHNLPERVAEFVGRTDDIAAVRRRLAESRLVTLTGPGGVGKTSLAVEVARLAVGDYAHGVWLIDLAPLEGDEAVANAVSSVFGAGTDESALEGLAELLRTRSALIVLDNTEHVVEGSAHLAESLLAAAPGLRILTTGWERLGVPGESVVEVGGLFWPEAEAVATEEPEDLLAYDAVRLFASRAGAARTDFTLDSDTAPAVVDICRQLDGLPLAIELAASQLDVLGPVELLAALEDRFAVLNRSRSTTSRHRSLHAAVDWGYSSLSDVERTVFDRLSVFAGAFDVEAVAAVAGDGIDETAVRDALRRLVQTSMVAVEQAGEGTRFRLLDTFRSFGRERLSPSEIGTLRARHAAYYAELVQRTAPAPTAAEAVTETLSQTELDVLESSRHEFSAALDWTLETGDRRTALDIVGHLSRYWWRRGFFAEGLVRCREVFEDRRDSEASPQVALALAASSWTGLGACDLAWATAMIERLEEVADALDDVDSMFAASYVGAHVDWRLGHLEAAAETMRRLIATARSRNEAHRLAVLLDYGGSLAVKVGELDEAEACVAELMELGSAYGSMVAHDVRQNIAFFRGDLDTAADEAEGLLRMAGTEKDTVIIVYGLLRHARIAIHRQDGDRARTEASRALGIARPAGMRTEVANAQRLLARVAAMEGDLEAARELLTVALRGHVATQDHLQMMWDVRFATELALRAGDPDTAAPLLGAALREIERMGLVLAAPDRRMLDEDLAALETYRLEEWDMADAIDLVLTASA